MMADSGSAATANLSRHSSLENLICVAMSSCDTPTTVAPSAANLSVASANRCASSVQPLVNDLGKKYSTTGPFLSASASTSGICLPPTAASVVNSGALSPGLSAAWAELPRQASAAAASSGVRQRSM